MATNTQETTKTTETTTTPVKREMDKLGEAITSGAKIAEVAVSGAKAKAKKTPKTVEEPKKAPKVKAEEPKKKTKMSGIEALKEIVKMFTNLTNDVAIANRTVKNVNTTVLKLKLQSDVNKSKIDALDAKIDALDAKMDNILDKLDSVGKFMVLANKEQESTFDKILRKLKKKK